MKRDNKGRFIKESIRHKGDKVIATLNHHTSPNQDIQGDSEALTELFCTHLNGGTLRQTLQNIEDRLFYRLKTYLPNRYLQR